MLKPRSPIPSSARPCPSPTDSAPASSTACHSQPRRSSSPRRRHHQDSAGKESPPRDPRCYGARRPSPRRQQDSGARGGQNWDTPGGDGSGPLRVFDLCPDSGPACKLKPSLLEINKEKRREAERLKNGPGHRRLRSGMVLLKKYLSHGDQVSLTKQCREIGLGPGGFYRPGYKDGAKLNLMMMCLGKNWDPQTKKYEDRRSIDNVVPPQIPGQFLRMVEEVMQASQTLLKQMVGGCVVDELPCLSPDLCIVNYYSNTGNLGLHQDRDESQDSLRKRLPVVSFSLGDTAVFLYGESRDMEAAEEVELESGDVLIFGGESRHLFHGVSKIIPNTAPKSLLADSNLRPGRLNLTFRQY